MNFNKCICGAMDVGVNLHPNYPGVIYYPDGSTECKVCGTKTDKNGIYDAKYLKRLDIIFDDEYKKKKALAIKPIVAKTTTPKCFMASEFNRYAGKLHCSNVQHCGMLQNTIPVTCPENIVHRRVFGQIKYKTIFMKHHRRLETPFSK